MAHKHHGPGALAGAAEAEAVFVTDCTHEYSHIPTHSQPLAVRRLCAKFGMPIATAATVAALAGFRLGGAA